MAEYFAEVRKIYADYLERTERLERDRKPGEGMFGTAGPKTDPCHTAFADALKDSLDAAARGGLSSAGALEILEYMAQAPVEQEKNRLAYWMLLAVHGLAPPLAELLDAGDAGKLLALYLRLYPKNQWLPAQEKLVKLLRARQRG